MRRSLILAIVLLAAGIARAQEAPTLTLTDGRKVTVTLLSNGQVMMSLASSSSGVSMSAVGGINAPSEPNIAPPGNGGVTPVTPTPLTPVTPTPLTPVTPTPIVRPSSPQMYILVAPARQRIRYSYRCRILF